MELLEEIECLLIDALKRFSIEQRFTFVREFSLAATQVGYDYSFT